MRSVRVSEFKTKIAKYLKLVKKGEEMEILERDTPVARVIGVKAETPLSLEPAQGGSKLLWASLDGGQKKGRPIELTVNPLELLFEERRKR